MHSARLHCDLEKDFVPVSSSQPPVVAVLSVCSAPDCPCGCDVPCSTTRRLLGGRASITGGEGGDLHISSLTNIKPTCPLCHEILAQKLTLLRLHQLWFTFKENKVICPLAQTTPCMKAFFGEHHYQQRWEPSSSPRPCWAELGDTVGWNLLTQHSPSLSHSCQGQHLKDLFILGI